MQPQPGILDPDSSTAPLPHLNLDQRGLCRGGEQALVLLQSLLNDALHTPASRAKSRGGEGVGRHTPLEGVENQEKSQKSGVAHRVSPSSCCAFPM